MVPEPQPLPDVPGLDLAQRLYAKGVDVFNDCDVQLTEVGQRDPKVIALTILGRTLSEMRAATLLVDNDHVVEARTLVRGMYENLFWAAALTKKGAEFVKEMALDDITARKARVDGLLQWAKAQPTPPEFTEKLGDFHAGLVADHGKTWGIKLQQAAAAGGVKDGYIIYRELSTDAAHPSAESLSRHVTVSDDENAPPFTVHAHPTIGDYEAADTIELMCSAALGVVVAVNEILGGVATGENLVGLADAFGDLGAANKAARDGADRQDGA